MYEIYNGFDYGGMMNFFNGGIMMIIFWVIVIYFIVWLVRNNRINNINKSNKALEILEERYAKGEIDKKEFKEKKKDLNK